MSWLLFTLLAGILWTIVNVVDKHIIGHEFRDPILAIVLKSFVIFVVFTCTTLIVGQPVMIGRTLIILGIVIGILVSAGVYFYYGSLNKGDVSKVVPIFSTAPLFTLLLGAIFLGERFAIPTYFGIILIVFGAITISAKHMKHRFALETATLFAAGVAVTSAVRSMLVKMATQEVTIWQILFWIGIGMLLVAIPMFIWHYHHIKIQSKKRFRHAVEHLLVVDFFDALGFLFLMIAISLGPVSLVTAILHTKPLLVFIIATTLSVFFPSYLHERMTASVLAQKVAGTLLIVGGALLVTVYM